MSQSIEAYTYWASLHCAGLRAYMRVLVVFGPVKLSWVGYYKHSTINIDISITTSP